MSCFSFPFITLYNIIMNKNTKPLKYIFENHFHQTWNNIKHKFPKNLHSSIWNNVSKFLDCGDISRGYTAFKCNQCSHMHIVGFSCKSRFCSSCGKIYAENWALNLKGVPSGKRGITTLRIFLTTHNPFIFNVFQSFSI